MCARKVALNCGACDLKRATDPAQNAASAGTATYYAWTPKRGVRFISLDTSSVRFAKERNAAYSGDAVSTNASVVHYKVTFSEAVTGLILPQFTLTTTGAVTGASVAGITPVAGSNGTQFTVAVNTGTGSGTIALNFAGASFFGIGAYTSAVLGAHTALPHLVVLAIGGLLRLAEIRRANVAPRRVLTREWTRGFESLGYRQSSLRDRKPYGSMPRLLERF